MKLIDFPRGRQTYGYDCGAKALQMVLVYYGIELREDKIIKMAKTTTAGTPIAGILHVAEKYGLHAEAKQMTIDDLKKYISHKKPVILVLQAWTEKDHVNWKKDWADGHYVVAVGYDRKRIYFEDPAAFLRTYIPIKDLMARWHDVDTEGKKYFNYGIVFHGLRHKFEEDKFEKME
jgi:ABC-type bacteriocin/lantibiotic exporter with double-glycine peptidase domain